MSLPQHWLGSFLEAMAAERGAAANTLAAYERDLSDAARWLAARGLDFAVATEADFEAYLVGLTDEGLSKATRARRLSALKQLYRFAFEDGLRQDNPVVQISGPGKDKALPKTLSLEEVDRLLEAARSGGRAADRLRNTCLMELLYATGMRVSELVSLPAAAARGDPRMLLIRGKGGKERMVPLSPPAREALAAWLAQRDKTEAARREAGHAVSAFLFPSHGKAGHLTRHAFYALIKGFAVAGGVSPEAVSPHTLRHLSLIHISEPPRPY